MGRGKQRQCAELPAALGGTDRAYRVLNWPACPEHLLAVGTSKQACFAALPATAPHALHLPLTLPSPLCHPPSSLRSRHGAAQGHGEAEAAGEGEGKEEGPRPDGGWRRFPARRAAGEGAACIKRRQGWQAAVGWWPQHAAPVHM